MKKEILVSIRVSCLFSHFFSIGTIDLLLYIFFFDEKPSFIYWYFFFPLLCLFFLFLFWLMDMLLIVYTINYMCKLH